MVANEMCRVGGGSSCSREINNGLIAFESRDPDDYGGDDFLISIPWRKC